MANQWLRLWHDMPNDPKWRTIARASGQSISLVLAVYVHMLVDASRNVTRGHVDVTNEDLASALDVTEDAISAIRGAMQSRVLQDMALSGWSTRQPSREDSGDAQSGAKSSTERKREERERKKTMVVTPLDYQDVTQCHDLSRNVTTDKDKEEIKSSPPVVPLPGDSKPKDGKRVRGMRLPEGWGLDPSHETGLAESVREVARDLKNSLETDWTGATVRYHFDEFASHFRASANRNALKNDWQAAWRNWCSKAMRELPGRDPVRRDIQAAKRRDEARA